MMINTLATRAAPLIGAGLLTALTAGCGNGLVSSGPATQSELAKPSSSSSATPSPSAGSATTPTTPKTTGATGASAAKTPADATAADSTLPAGPASSAKTSSTSSGTVTSPSSSSSQTGPTSSTSSATSSRACRLGSLSVGVQDSAGGGAAGSNYVVLTFTNKGSGSCRMYGYPGVSFVGDSNGTQLGAAADRSNAGKERSVTLAPGHRTTALLQIANAADFDAKTCAPTTSDGFRIYPPGSTTSAYVPFKTQACQRSGAKQLIVSPVGTSG